MLMHLAPFAQQGMTKNVTIFNIRLQNKLCVFLHGFLHILAFSVGPEPSWNTSNLTVAECTSA